MAFLLQSDIDNAGHQLNAIHDQLLALQTQLTGDMAKQDALMWGLRRTYKALLLYSKQHSKARIIDVPKAKTLLPATMQCSLMN